MQEVNLTSPLEVQATPEDSEGREHNSVMKLVDDGPIKSPSGLGPWANPEVQC